jgi:hypothetical protein
MPPGTLTAGNDLELRGDFLDCLILVDGLDGAERPELGGGAVDVPGGRLRRFRFLRHAASIGRRVNPFNRAASLFDRPAASVRDQRRRSDGRAARQLSKRSTFATGQTSELISARRLPRGIVAIRRNEEKNNEMPDYFVFVAWACRLLLDWPLCQRQR